MNRHNYPTQQWLRGTRLALSTLLVTLWQLSGPAVFAQQQGGELTPWPRQYKIKPHQRDRLTAADVVGPDGVVYPNWTCCGLQDQPSHPSRRLRLRDFGARPNDDRDDSQALAEACRAAGPEGATIVLEAGLYYLDRPVTIRSNNVVIVGAGPEKTRLIFRYRLPESGISFYLPEPGSRVGPQGRIELHCAPTGLQQMRILVDGQLVGSWSRGKHSGNTFSFAVTGHRLLSKVSDGPHQLEGIAIYRDGIKRSTRIPIYLDSKFQPTEKPADSRAAITFAGIGPVGPRIKLTRDGKRGQSVLWLAETKRLKVGDCIYIEAPATERWNKLTRNACKWGLYRAYEVVITKIEGKKVTINQPLRIDFPVVDGAYVQKIVPIQHCGIERLYIEQTQNLWITAVLFSHAWNCWARDLVVKKCGRFPVYGSRAKWCEIRDCVFDDAWFKGGGGTAYTGWDHCWDCLMENVETFKMRHGPLFQWGSSGCVIRKSIFHQSDAQWHAGWTHENLIEQCVIESTLGHGGYGYGMWASPPEDTAHGPNGPRNVVHNCDIRCPKAGLWMGGMNENWLILHNRFVVDNGPGVFAKTASFDHIIRDNVFVLKNGRWPMVHLASADCVGIEIVGNRLFGGNGQLVTGPGRAEVLTGNKVAPLQLAPRPVPEPASIYQWQQQRKRR